MIVRDETDALALVTQPDHAALSGRIMRAWRADGLPSSPTRASVLLATDQHDNGWREIDDRPPIDPATGQPVDFMDAPSSLKQQVWPRGIARVAATDPRAAALVTQHALTIHDGTESPSWGAFCARTERARDGFLAEGAYAGRLDALLADYRFVFLGDLLSLVLCCRWSGPFHHHGYTVSLEGETVVVVPDPFGGRIVPLSVPARRLSRCRFGSDAELRRAYQEAAVIALTGTAVGRPPA